MSICPFKGHCYALPRIQAHTLTEEEQDRIIHLALAIAEARHRPGALLCNPNATRKYLRLLLQSERNEIFGCIFLNTKNQVIAQETLSQGTLSSAVIYTRNVVEAAIKHNASAVLFYHNHPSGSCKASDADIAITKRLRQALDTVDIQVLDHFIVSAIDSASMTEKGLI